MRDTELTEKYAKTLDEDDSPESSVDEILEEPGPGFSEGFDMVKRHHRMLGANRPVDVKDFDKDTIAMLEKAAMSDPTLTITLIKRGYVTPELGDVMARKGAGKSPSEMKAETKQLPKYEMAAKKMRTWEKDGAGGWKYQKTDGGFKITAAPSGYEDRVGLVVKPGMKGFDAIEEEFGSMA
jgi:hypothetical protein